MHPLCAKCRTRPRHTQPGGRTLSWCVECNRENFKIYRRRWQGKRPEYQKEWHAKNPGKRVQYSRRHEYGLEPEEFFKRMKSQEGKCAICKEQTTLVVDHDHTTGEVRGLLCRKCNVGLGAFQDIPNILRAAIGYLELVA